MKNRALLLMIFASLALVCACAQAEETLTWEDCVREAAKNNPALISSKESVKSTEAAKSITASGLFPQVSASAGVTKSKTETSGSSGGDGNNGGGGSSNDSSVNNYNYGVSGNQLIFDGFKTANQVNAASEDIKAAQENYKFTSSDVRLSLRTAFIELLKAQEGLRIKEEIYERRRQNFELVTLRYESGQENKGSLLTEQANLIQARFDVTQAGRDIDLSRRKLSKEMGRSDTSEITAKGDFKVAEEVREMPDFSVIAQDNPSLKQLIAQKNSAIFNLKSARAEFMPEVTASGSAGRSDTNWPPENNNWSIGASVSLPIFEGGKRLADVKKATAQLNKAEADLTDGLNSVVETLQDRWTSLQQALDNVSVQKEFLTANEERAKITEAQYSIGFVSFNDWIIIENNLVDAKNSYLEAQANALVAEANWIQAKGETIENVEK
ncbi:MAG: TolC family protein [Candidatus Omnitrophota bacterium]